MSPLRVVSTLGRSRGWRIKGSESRGGPQSKRAKRPACKHRPQVNTVSHQNRRSCERLPRHWGGTTYFWTGERTGGPGAKERKASLRTGTQVGEKVSFMAVTSQPTALSSPTPSTRLPAREKVCSQEVKQENVYESLINDAMSQIHDPENTPVGTSKANCV